MDTARWPTAEEEKVRLFTQAQNNARIVQGYAQDLNESRASHGRAASRDSSLSFQQGSQGRPPVISAGAALYSHAMASVNKPGWGGPVATPLKLVPSLASHKPQSSRLPSAAEEKEMLRRYHNATRAVQQHHEANFGSSDGIMPSASSSLLPDSTAAPYPGDLDHPTDPAPDELPPPWVPSPEFSQTEGLSEKERYRIAYEARERAAAAAAEQQPASPHPPANPASPPADYYTATGTPHPGVNDSDLPPAAADGGLPPPWHPAPPPPLPPHLRARSPPVPPSPSGSPRMLSAAEEKALLRARYEAEEKTSAPPPSATPPRQHSPSRAPFSLGMLSPMQGESPDPREQSQAPVAATPASPRTPPPLRPRPPASYIQETAEEDARLQDELASGKLSTSASGTTTATASVPASEAVSAGTGMIGLGDDTFGLLRPTSPFAIGWESIAARSAGTGNNASTNGFGSPLPPSPPPPLPPKVPLGH
ncbi:hypothetical protein BJV78DRAFT_179885 [Lactifluus subvellereus]|nr:hypothetical protein BJV78DRAFT_179885 [Lactifluus subvellereus]